MKPSLRFYELVAIGVTVIGLATVALAPSAALATHSPTSQLRRAWAQTFLAFRLTGNAGVCSATTPQGQIALIEMLRGEDRYLPSTTCTEAFVGHAEAEATLAHPCNWFQPEVREAMKWAKTATIHVRGNRATITLTEDFRCEREERLFGTTAVLADPMGTSHWARKRGRWLFDDQPTGTYSPAGRKAVAVLRAALSGRSITEEGLPGLTLTVPFCTNGTTQPVVTIKGEITVEAPVFWYVAAGLSVSGQHEPLFDAQGDPQGYVTAPDSISDEWNVKLVGGVLAMTQPPDRSIPVGTPGSAGC